jgi:hypothetical protein
MFGIALASQLLRKLTGRRRKPFRYLPVVHGLEDRCLLTTFNQFPLPQPVFPARIAAGGDGNLWFTSRPVEVRCYLQRRFRMSGSRFFSAWLGNHDRRRRPARCRPELLNLEDRTLPSTISWLRPVSGEWHDAANWAGGQVPTRSDDAVIPFAGITVTVAGTLDAVHSLRSEAAFDLHSTLAVGDTIGHPLVTSRIDAAFRVLQGGDLLFFGILDGTGTLSNFNRASIGGSINVAVDNEGILDASGQINNDADRPFVNGPAPGATLGVLTGLTFRNGFTNQGRLFFGPFSSDLVVANGALVNTAEARMDFVTDPMGHGQHAVHANIENWGILCMEGGETNIGDGSATIDNDGTIDIRSGSVNLMQSSFTNRGTIHVYGGLAVSGGTFDDQGSIDGVAPLAFSETQINLRGDFSNDRQTLVLQNSTLNLTGTLTNVGTLDITASTINAGLFVNRGQLTAGGPGGTAVINAPFMNPAGSIMNVQGNLLVTPGFTNEGAINLSIAPNEGSTTVTVSSGTLTNAPGGTIAVQAGDGVYFLTAALENEGTLAVGQDTILSGSLTNGGTLDVSGGDLIVHEVDPAAPVVNTGSITVAGMQGLILEGGDFANAGTVSVGLFGTLLVTGAYTQTGGLTSLDGGFLTTGAGVDLEGGILGGSGVINANVLNNAEIDVGQPGAPGILTIVGDYSQAAGGVLVIDIGGPDPGTDFDQLNITGQATLDGALTVNLINGFQPNAGDSFTIMTFGSGTGAFATLDGDGPLFTPSYDPTEVTLVAN